MRPDRESKLSKEEGVSHVQMRRPLAIASASRIVNALDPSFVCDARLSKELAEHIDQQSRRQGRVIEAGLLLL